MPRELIAIGIIRRPVGLAGLCAVEAFGATFPALEPPCAVYLGKNAAEAEQVTIEEIIELPGGYQCRFAGRSDIESVDGLRGASIFIEESALSRPDANAFFHFELKGLPVYADSSGELIGTVVEVHNLPSMDTIEIARKNAKSILLPLFDQAIVEIDIAGKRIIVCQSFVEELLQ